MSTIGCSPDHPSPNSCRPVPCLSHSYSFTPHQLDSQMNMYNEYECDTCDREFNSQHASNQHMNALNHWAPRYDCETCDRECLTQWSANQHMDDTGHWKPQFECETCDRRLYGQNSANQHMNDTRHWAPQFECEICDRRFHSQNYANQHMDAVNHWKRRYCHDCNRGFQNENTLRMVRSSCMRQHLLCTFPPTFEIFF